LRISPIAIVVTLMVTLTACANDASQTQENEVSQIPVVEDYLEGVWSFELTQTLDFQESEPAPVCSYNLYDQWTCEFWFYVTNKTKIPQEFDGYTYLVADDGRIFESTDKPSFDRLNPGESRLETPTFKIPNKDFKAVSIFRAWSATSNKYYEYMFPVLWNLAD
jgi:hypothetical protein